jgi:very-short-patch-repair endonuclease
MKNNPPTPAEPPPLFSGADNDLFDREWLKAEGLVWMGKSLPYNPRLKEKAKDLRKNSTPEENLFWYDFLSKYKHKFLRQKIIGHYIVDFHCAKYRLVIEIDGSQHYTEDGMEYDAIRSDYLELFKINILRFTNQEVKDDFENVCEKIKHHIKQNTVKSPPK